MQPSYFTKLCDVAFNFEELLQNRNNIPVSRERGTRQRTAEQRMRWFMKGYRTGDFNQGDTFNATTL